MPETYLTRNGYEKLKKDLDGLKKLKAELSVEIGEAMAQGDLRENAGYTAAKERQAEILRRIDDLEMKLKNARLIDDLNLPKDEARIGATVTIKDEEGEESRYVLVGPDESDFASGKISVLSPLAQGLMGHKAGQDVNVQLPAGTRKFRIMKVEF